MPVQTVTAGVFAWDAIDSDEPYAALLLVRAGRPSLVVNRCRIVTVAQHERVGAWAQQQLHAGRTFGLLDAV